MKRSVIHMEKKSFERTEFLKRRYDTSKGKVIKKNQIAPFPINHNSYWENLHRMVTMHLVEKQVHDQFECTLFSLYWHIVRNSISWCYSVKRSPLYLVSVPADRPIQDSRSSHSLFHPEDDFYPQAGLNQKTDFSLSSWAEPPPQWPSSIHQELELSFLKM